MDFDVTRINELARKAKVMELTQEEKKEQESLRIAYIESFRNNMKATLDNVYIVEKDGTKKKLEPKKEQK